MFGALSALGSIASLASKLVAFFSAMVTRKDQIELGQDRQKTVDQAAVIAADSAAFGKIAEANTAAKKVDNSVEAINADVDNLDRKP